MFYYDLFCLLSESRCGVMVLNHFFIFFFSSEETYRFIFLVIAVVVTNLKSSLFKAGLVPKP